MISFSCSKCGKSFSLKPEFAGRKTTCSGCKEPLVVPTLAARPRIAFSCGTCGMKFNVPEEFAGRTTRCPTCKQALKVPSVQETVGYAPAAGRINGAPSSLASVGVEGGVTLGNLGSGGDSASRQTPVADLLQGKSNAGGRYVIEKELARGGMGAVWRAVDCDIRREVAVKYLLNQASTNNRLRFIEEAQITGQLEHPNIVPIHELGVDAEKRIFFSMKMVKGRSLQAILKALQNDPKEEIEYSRGRLLNVLINVCNALEYAHARGVVHRDLKPANIMVGDFGEVYVMDWGLAKVLKRPDVLATAPVMAIPVAVMAPSGPFDFTAAAPPPLAVPVSETVEEATPSGATQVVTSREADADLTQDGVVIGTPVYMPPEQAAGRVQDIDERSDVYSLGAILYEMLTLRPPIERGGGLAAIILRVAQGRIDPPEQKAPDRAKAGKIPPELAAIAMKALASDKGARYQSIAEFRRDIDRFMEGRSVSAKPDTVREMAVKLVKRNRGASIATAAATVILFFVAIWSLVSILSANKRRQDAYDAYIAEQKEKQALAKRSVPSLVRAARMLVSEKKFDEALTQVDAAIAFDDAQPDARLVRAQLLLHQFDFSGARHDLEICLKQKSSNEDATRLLEIMRDGRSDNIGTLAALAKELIEQKSPQLAERLTQQAQKLMGTKAEMLLVHQVRVEAAWPGHGTSLRVDNVGKYGLEFPGRMDVKDLEGLRGVPLSYFVVNAQSKVTDLAPLKGMPLERLAFNSTTAIANLSALQGMPLTEFSIHSPELRDLAPLKGMALKKLDLSNCNQLEDMAPLQGMPTTSLNLQNCVKITDLAPLRGMPLTYLNLKNDARVTDIAPLKGMPLAVLEADGVRLSDISALQGMPLTRLAFDATMQLRDLSPLKGAPLTQITLANAGLNLDLSPLKGAPLTDVALHNGQVTNLAPVAGPNLKRLHINVNPALTDLSPLKKSSLTGLYITRCPKIENLALDGLSLSDLAIDRCPKISDIRPLKGMKIVKLTLNETDVSDLEPLRGMPLTEFRARSPKIADLRPLAGMQIDVLDLTG
ncbi:MAG TPA: protein kinase, partial [Gemmataceae bacterium]|nr:protein kinase [Gemmataceae bacterium]